MDRRGAGVQLAAVADRRRRRPGTQVRCIVESDKNGTAGRAVSNVAKLWVRLDVAPPANPSIDETKLSASSARLTWECDAQVKGTFTVEYRAAGGEWVAIDDIEGNEAVLKDLAPATAYEWRVTHVLAPGLQSATVDGPGFTTKAGSALSEAKVTPEVVVADEGQKASFDVSTNVDGDASEKLSYVWQTAPRGSDAWADVPGANGSHLELTVGSDDLGTQVRCVVSSAKDGGRRARSATRRRCGSASKLRRLRTSRWTRTASPRRRRA